MLCQKCGAQLNDDARFCNNCGNAVEAVGSWQPANDQAGFAAAPQVNPYTYPQNTYNPNPYPQNTYDPNVYPQNTYDPSAYPTDGAAPKKSKKKLWFIIGGAVAVVAVVAVVLILVLGGSTPTSVVEDYFEASLDNDKETYLECLGFDHMEYNLIDYEDYYDDVDEVVEQWQDYMLDYFFEDVKMDESKWEKRLKKVDNWEDFIEFRADFFKAYQDAYNDEYDVSFEITEIEEEELTSRSDVKAAKNRVEMWFEENDDYESAYLFDEDDVKSYYLVTGEYTYEMDGDEAEWDFSMLVVDTSEGCFIIDTDWEP